MNPQTNKKKAVIYCRVSTKEQVEEGNSLVTQERNCREYAIKNGYEIASVFVEQGESAKTADRTELQKLFAYCANKKNEIKAIIAYKIDRISRNTDDYSQIRILLKRYGVEIKSTSEYFENTPAGRFMENIIANVAQFDNDVRAERSVGGMVQALREGRYVWMAPIGYSNSKVGGKTNLVQNEFAPLIKLAFEEIANRLYSVDEVRHRLASLGIRTKKGQPIPKGHLYRILKNKIYFGEIHQFGEINYGIYKPIISKELFLTVQLVLQNRKRILPYLLENPDFPLRRFAYHLITNEKLTGSWSQGKTKKYPYYRFISSKILISKEKMEKLFSGFLDSFSFDTQLVSLLKKEIRENITQRVSSNEKTQLKYHSETNRLKEKQRIILQKNLDNIISDTLLKESMSEIEKELLIINQAYEEKQESVFDLASVFEYLYKFLENPSKIWANLPFKTKVQLQWFVFPKGISFDGKKIQTPETSFVFKLKGYFLSPNFPNVSHPNFNTNNQKNQIPLSSSQEDKDHFWLLFQKELMDFNELLHKPEFQDEEVIKIFNIKGDKKRRKTCR